MKLPKWSWRKGKRKGQEKHELSKDHRLHFGKYYGKRLEEVPLKYLDWAVGWLEERIRESEGMDSVLLSMDLTIIRVYLSDPVIAAELRKELEN